MNTSRKLHLGMMATAAAVAVLTGCQRKEADTTVVTPPPATSTAPATSPGTSGYTGPAVSDTPSSSSSSTMTSPGAAGTGTGTSGSDLGTSSAPGGSTSSSGTSSTDTTTPGTSGYVGGSTSSSPSSGADTTISDQDRYRSGGGTISPDSGSSGSGTSGGSGSGTSGGSGSGTTTGPNSSIAPADRPFRDVAVATPGAARGPAAWREVLGVEVLRVADADKATTMDKASGKLSKKDESFIKKAATDGMFEVEAARLATEKATDPQLKTFAEKLRDQHQQANDELKQIATARGMTMPTQMPSRQKAMLDKLTKASGDKFDKEFISMVGLRDHKQDIRDFENARNETTDTELKAWIEKTLPTLRTHLAEAQQISGHEGMKMQGYGGPKPEDKGGN